MKNYKLIVFDLDGTLAESKSRLDEEMVYLLAELLRQKHIAIISGGSYKQFQKQVLPYLRGPKKFYHKLYLLPTCGTSFYRYDNSDWVKVYSHDLSKSEKAKINLMSMWVMCQFHSELGLPNQSYGAVIEDRGSQITLSMLGQEAPIKLKEQWDPDRSKRLVIQKKLQEWLQEFEIRIGGTTSIDITRKGIDKAYGMKQLEKESGFKKGEILFIGDALFEGGNDYPVKKAGYACMEVKDVADTKGRIKGLLK